MSNIFSGPTKNVLFRLGFIKIVNRLLKKLYHFNTAHFMTAEFLEGAFPRNGFYQHQLYPP